MSSNDYHIAAEGDLRPSASRQIWYYFIILGILLAATVGSLIIMYRFSLVNEKQVKIGEVESIAVRDYKALNEALLSGKHGLFSDKHYVPIQSAMAKFLHEIRQ